MRIILKKDQLKFVINHAIDEYPKEACGIFGGNTKEEKFIIEKVYKVKNASLSPYNSYLIDPLDELYVFRDIEKNGLKMLGVYHSHPEKGVEPSLDDINHMLKDIFYLILAIKLKDNLSLDIKGYIRNNSILNEITIVVI
uniref:M67 family peptidase n=1 Tax=Dictyoglomus thermophilum TaxID=14 RepID=A0A7C3RKF2_DICTH